jgi:hypothetical protein
MKKGFVVRADEAAATAAINPGGNNVGSAVIDTYTNRDVLNGRGQGVQRHPGNVKYRTLVYVNKVSS